MLELINLTKTYILKKKKVHAVRGITASFDRGEFVSILGLSGSGKTTLVSLIGGLEAPTEGSLLIDGIDTSGFKKSDWTDYRKNTIGFVFQDFNLIQHLNALDNVKISLSLSGMNEKDKDMRAKELLERVGMLSAADQFPSQMSGGQQQRIAIARALANSPEIILVDEPTGALDPDTSVQIMELLKSLSEAGHLVIMVTHDKYLASDYSTRIITISDGQVTSDSASSDIVGNKSVKKVFPKSSLQIGAAFKVALNNLRIRKKSTIFAIASLIPSMILVMILGNFIANVSGYRNDILPLHDQIVSSEEVLYITPMDDNKYEWDMRNTFRRIEKKTNITDNIKDIENTLIEPFDEDTLKAIAETEGVLDVIRPMYLDVYIDGNHFILVGLLPEEYSKYQPDIPKSSYPDDDEEGLIFSSEAAKVILGKYANDIDSLIGEDFTMELTSFNGAPLSYWVYNDNRNIFETSVIKVFDPEAKTTLLSNYYKGYIFASYGYMNSILDQFTGEDICMTSYQPLDPFDVRARTSGSDFIILGPQYMTDLLQPLRTKTMLQENMNLFSFREYAEEVPSGTFGLKYMVITDGGGPDLTEYGVITPSRFDSVAVSSAKETKRLVDMVLLGSKAVTAVIILIPSLLVSLILYISIILRTKEIGVLKSIGAKSRDIMTIFTMESGLLASVSGIIALVFVVPVLAILRSMVEMQYNLRYYLGSNPLDLNIMAILISFISIVILITALGLLPGRKASKLHPRVLLRHIN